MIEDTSGMAAPGKHVHLRSDARPGGIDQIEERNVQVGSCFLDAKDLFDGLWTPGTSFHSRVIRHVADGAAMYSANPRYHCISRIALVGRIGEKAVLNPEPGI